MKKIATILFLLFSTFITLNAKDITGETIYDTKCKSCHMLNIPKEMTKKMLKDMKAPPMEKVSAKIKSSFDNNESKSIAFIADYIVSPDANKSLCMPRAIKAFGLMPPIGKSMSKEEVSTVSKWLITNFKNKWKVTEKGELCKSKVKCNGVDCNATTSKCTKKDCKIKDCDGKDCISKKCNGADCNSTTSKCTKSDCNTKNCNGKNCDNNTTAKHPGMKCGEGKCGGDKMPKHPGMKCGGTK